MLRVKSHRGSVGGRRADVTLDAGTILLVVDGKSHGPRPIVGSVKNIEKGAAWIIGMGSTRVRFVADDPQQFTRDLTEQMVTAQADPSEFFDNLYQMAPTVADGIESLSRVFDIIAQTSTMLGEDSPDYSDIKERLEVLARIHRRFMEHLAPRGWTFSRVLDWGVPRLYRVAIDMIDLANADPEDVDEWLAPQVLKDSHLGMIVQDIATTPVRAIWQWTSFAGEAAAATRDGMYALSAEGWMTIAEGLWRDLREWVGGPSRFYRKGSLVDQTLTENITQSWESLVVAHDVMSRQMGRTIIEAQPIERAPTSRHGLIHGRIAGAVRSVHGAKALALVDGILEQAKRAMEFANPSDLEPPPWT